jgi:hypothetical protein
MFKRNGNALVLAVSFTLLMGSVFYEVLNGNSLGFLILMVFGPVWLLYALISAFFYVVLRMRKPVGSVSVVENSSNGASGHMIIFVAAVLALSYTGYHLNVADTFQNCFSFGPTPKDSTLCMLEFPAFIIEIFSVGIILYYVWQSWRGAL